MANRLTKIYTRTGDKGETGLASGERVAKDSAIMHAQGDVDELNSLLGLLACKLEGDICLGVKTIQNDLFDLGGELSCAQPLIKQDRIDWLEQKLDQLNEDLPVLKEFILPGGGEAASLCHLARSVCRRAERHLVTANREAEISALLLAYINRLSDLLFVMARFITRQQGESEVYWQSSRIQEE
ncbi:MAG: cob(I)yrinic acid a,c-diamide adenosyltransferase [Gammaproteobacteria bacterium]|nr:cob(I)yrinic acid a,c-diamide adenosyltransferase [Gammaproteobacteria bacterium]MCW8924050.1 cob(I)yrinic acid a,c-diamide adenosyltransferase [Gammaproteobacteria bacterium]